MEGDDNGLSPRCKKAAESPLPLCSAVAVVVAEGGGERGNRDAVQGGDTDDFASVLLGLAEHVLEERVEHEMDRRRAFADGRRRSVIKPQKHLQFVVGLAEDHIEGQQVTVLEVAVSR